MHTNWILDTKSSANTLIDITKTGLQTTITYSASSPKPKLFHLNLSHVKQFGTKYLKTDTFWYKVIGNRYILVSSMTDKLGDAWLGLKGEGLWEECFEGIQV